MANRVRKLEKDEESLKKQIMKIQAQAEYADSVRKRKEEDRQFRDNFLQNKYEKKVMQSLRNLHNKSENSAKIQSQKMSILCLKSQSKESVEAQVRRGHERQANLQQELDFQKCQRANYIKE